MAKNRPVSLDIVSVGGAECLLRESTHVYCKSFETVPPHALSVFFSFSHSPGLNDMTTETCRGFCDKTKQYII